MIKYKMTKGQMQGLSLIGVKRKLRVKCSSCVIKCQVTASPTGKEPFPGTNKIRVWYLRT